MNYGSWAEMEEDFFTEDGEHRAMREEAEREADLEWRMEEDPHHEQETDMFQGIHTFKNYRVVSRGGNFYSVYRKDDDAFIHAGTMRIEGEVTEEKVDEEFHQYPNEYDFSNEYGY